LNKRDKLLASFLELKELARLDITERLDYWEKQAEQERMERMRYNFNSIEGVSDAIRLPRIGKIHLGIKKKNSKGVEYPVQTDYFVVTPSDTTPENAAKLFKEVYGERPKELNIMFPLNDRESFFPQAYKRYSAAGLMCKGNGHIAIENVEGKLTERNCDPEFCEYFQKGHCKLRAHLQVILPDIPGLGVWQIDTGSFNSVRNINSAIAFVQALTGGRISMIPLKLIIRAHKGRDDKGVTTNNFVLDIASDKIKMNDILKASLMSPAKLLLPAVDFDAEDAEIFRQETPPEIIEESQSIEEEFEQAIMPVAENIQGEFCSNCGQKITKGVKTYSEKYFGKALCQECQGYQECQ